MAKLTLTLQPPPPPPPETKEVELELVVSSTGSVRLRVKDVIAGNILTVRADGTIKRHASVDRTLGFSQDERGRVLFTDE